MNLKEIACDLECHGAKDIKINKKRGWISFTDLKGNRAAYEPWCAGSRYIPPFKLEILLNDVDA